MKASAGGAMEGSHGCWGQECMCFRVDNNSSPLNTTTTTTTRKAIEASGTETPGRRLGHFFCFFDSDQIPVIFLLSPDQIHNDLIDCTHERMYIHMHKCARSLIGPISSSQHVDNMRLNRLQCLVPVQARRRSLRKVRIL